MSYPTALTSSCAPAERWGFGQPQAHLLDGRVSPRPACLNSAGAACSGRLFRSGDAARTPLAHRASPMRPGAASPLRNAEPGVSLCPCLVEGEAARARVLPVHSWRLR